VGCFVFIVPSVAHAYLDPGTGNILVYMVLSLLGAVAFSLKGVFYAVLGKKNAAEEETVQKDDNIVIFSEGKNYWHTFKPIVEALIARQQFFSFYTMDIDDPCLTIENKFINNKFIGSGNMAFNKIGNLQANMLLATTPNIGTPGYPIPKSKKIKNMIHVFHAVDDLAYYYRGSLDHYDSVMLVGEFETPIIRKLEKIRNLLAKKLYPAGLPYLDVMAQQMTLSISKENRKVETVLIAPSWGVKGCLVAYGIGFVEKLAQAGYNIIIRPHPYSMKVEKKFIVGLQNKLAKLKNITWDFAIDGTKAMEASDIMISDTSAVRFDYALLYQKPVITLEMPIPDPEAFEIADLKECWMDKAVNEIGSFVHKNEIENIVKITNELLSANQNYDLSSFKNKTIYNWGHSGEKIADYLISQIKEIKQQSGEQHNDI
jgi:hypothetical protein